MLHIDSYEKVVQFQGKLFLSMKSCTPAKIYLHELGIGQVVERANKENGRCSDDYEDDNSVDEKKTTW